MKFFPVTSRKQLKVGALFRFITHPEEGVAYELCEIVGDVYVIKNIGTGGKIGVSYSDIASSLYLCTQIIDDVSIYDLASRKETL